MTTHNHKTTQQGRHICFVTETYPPEVNGVAMTLCRLVNALLERDYKISLIRPKQSAFDREGCCDAPTTHLVKALPVPGYNAVRIGLIDKGRLRRLWGEQTPDVVYIATEGPLGSTALKIANELRIPVISGFHTNFHQYTRHYKLTFLGKPLLSYLRNFHNRCHLTLVPNENLLRELADSGFQRLSLFPRGVDTSQFNPRRRCQKLRTQWGLEKDTLACLYVGRVASEKNLPLAIESYHAIKKIRPDSRFIIIGDGPLYEPLRKQYPEIIFCGIQLGHELARHYASADLFLFPSETETFGNVVLEAMASGLAVVAFNYAAARMHITHAGNGLCVPVGDKEAFVSSALELAADSEQLLFLRSQAGRYAEKIDWQQLFTIFERHLLQTIPSSRIA